MLSAAHLANSQSSLHKEVVAIVFPMILEKIFLPLRLFPGQDAHQFSRLNKPAMRSPMNKQTQEVFEKMNVHTALLFITLLIENCSGSIGFWFSTSVFPL